MALDNHLLAKNAANFFFIADKQLMQEKVGKASKASEPDENAAPVDAGNKGANIDRMLCFC